MVFIVHLECSVFSEVYYLCQTILFVVQLAYDVIAKVDHDQMILFVVHVDPEVYYDDTIVSIVHVDCGLSEFFHHFRFNSYSSKMIYRTSENTPAVHVDYEKNSSGHARPRGK